MTPEQRVERAKNELLEAALAWLDSETPRHWSELTSEDERLAKAVERYRTQLATPAKRPEPAR